MSAQTAFRIFTDDNDFGAALAGAFDGFVVTPNGYLYDGEKQCVGKVGTITGSITRIAQVFGWDGPAEGPFAMRINFYEQP